MKAHTREIAGIQYVRAVAALLVVLDHVESLMALPKNFGRTAFGGVLSKGAIGVDLFFVVSGFIIAYVSLQQPLPRPRLRLADFMHRRFVRIVPFLWVCVIGYAGLRYLGRGSFPGMSYLRALVLYPIGEVLPVQVWTLRHEFLFYLVFGLSLLYLRRAAGWSLLLAYAAAPLVLGRITAGCGASASCALAGFAFNRINLLFCAGVLLGLAYIRRGPLPLLPARWGFPALLLAAAGLMVFGNLSGYEVSHLDGPVFAAGLVLCCAIVALAAFGIGGASNDRLSAFGLLLGDASFSIYLTHDAFASALLGFWSGWSPGAQPQLVFAVVTVISVGGGLLVHRCVERPLIRWSAAVLGRKPRGATVLPRAADPPVPG